MFWDERAIDRILKDVEIIIGRPLEAGKALVGGVFEPEPKAGFGLLGVGL
jgi:hypothetical protein